VPIEPGLSASVRREVADDDTARALGSGDLEVLGTPRLLAWCEQATMAALAPHVDTSRSTVGTRVELAHERATAVGSTVTVRADLVHVDGRLLRFDVVAEQDTDDGSSVVARGQLTRVLVDRDRFLVRAGIAAG
jgi:fluoroacetyl-CoA thioesterase